MSDNKEYVKNVMNKISALSCPTTIELRSNCFDVSFEAREIRYYYPIRIPKILKRFFGDKIITNFVDCTVVKS